MARLTCVLVIDSDPKGLDALSYGFDREGCRVVSTADPARAVDLARAERPQAVVFAARHGAASRELLETLARGAGLPVVALVAPEDADALAIPGVAQLPLPSFVRDVITAVRLRAALGPTSGGTEGELGVEGALSEYGIFFLTRTLLALRLSAVVLVERANRRGELRFHDGAVTAIQVGGVQGLPAFYQLLLWEEAALDVRLKPTAKRPPVARAADLFEEAERFLRDFAHAAKPLGSAHTVYAPSREPAEGEVPSEAAAIMRLLNGTRPLSEVIEESPYRVFDTLRIVAKLLDLSLIVAKDGGKAPISQGASPAYSPVLEEWLRGPASRPVVEITPPPVTTTPARRPVQPTVPSPMALAPSAPTGATAPPAAPVAASDGGKRKGTLRKDKDKDKQASASTAAASSKGAAPNGRAPAANAEGSGDGEINRPKEARGEIKSTRKTGASAVPAGLTRRPSVVIDLPPELLAESPPEPVPPPLPVSATVAPAAPAPAAPATVATPPVVPQAPPPAVAPAIAAPVSSLAKLAVTAPAAPTPIVTPIEAPRPSMPTPIVAPPIASVRPLGGPPPARKPTGSIEIDPALLAEMDAYELANSPKTPPPGAAAPSVPAPPATPPPQPAAPPVAIVAPPIPAAAPPSLSPSPLRTGAPRLTPSPEVVSFLRPEDRKPTPPPQPAVLPMASPTLVAPPVAGSAIPGSAEPRRPTPVPRRPSGEFDALEADFFAREADLYQREGVENFDDLDGKSRK